MFSAGLNPQAVQRPNVMQMSPSPTSIIASINQSNYLCSRTPEPITEGQIELRLKNNQRIEVLKVHKQDNYDLKNVIIIQSDIAQEYFSSNEICNQYISKLNKNIIYDQNNTLKVSCYSDGKQKYYLPTFTDNELCIPNTFAPTEDTHSFILAGDQNGPKQVAAVNPDSVIDERNQVTYLPTIQTYKCEYDRYRNKE